MSTLDESKWCAKCICSKKIFATNKLGSFYLSRSDTRKQYTKSLDIYFLVEKIYFIKHQDNI